MAIDDGACAGRVAPDDITFSYIKGRHLVPRGAQWDNAVSCWESFYSDECASFDTVVEINIETIIPTVTWGTSCQDSPPYYQQSS